MGKYMCKIYVKMYKIYFRQKCYNWNIFYIHFLCKSEIYSIKYILTYSCHKFQWYRNIFSWPKVVYVVYIFYFFGGTEFRVLTIHLLTLLPYNMNSNLRFKYSFYEHRSFSFTLDMQELDHNTRPETKD